MLILDRAKAASNLSPCLKLSPLMKRNYFRLAEVWLHYYIQSLLDSASKEEFFWRALKKKLS